MNKYNKEQIFKFLQSQYQIVFLATGRLINEYGDEDRMPDGVRGDYESLCDDCAFFNEFLHWEGKTFTQKVENMTTEEIIQRIKEKFKQIRSFSHDTVQEKMSEFCNLNEETN
ncbi:MAG: hypothetical protein WCT18_05120 [Patescibacteria group bacterium]